VALSDALTDLGNRRAFDARLEREWARHARSGRPIALLVLDVDRFKEVNDTLGHRAGDEVLRLVADALRIAVRAGDEAFRTGGDEFALIADADDQGAVAIAARVRDAVAGSRGAPVAISVSIGVASAPGPGIDSSESLLVRADRALYEAKRAGRGRIASASSLRAVERPPI
jgi:diguanylate cyclase (GGDEF)-like protein